MHPMAGATNSSKIRNLYIIDEMFEQNILKYDDMPYFLNKKSHE